MGHSLEMFLNVYSELIDEYSSKDNSIIEGFGIGSVTDKMNINPAIDHGIAD